jgi:hypothetical protein
MIRRPLAAAAAPGGKTPPPPQPPPPSAKPEDDEEPPYVSVDKRTLYEDVSRLMRPEKVEKSPMTPLGELLKASIKRVSFLGGGLAGLLGLPTDPNRTESNRIESNRMHQPIN